jgi:sortase A
LLAQRWWLLFAYPEGTGRCTEMALDIGEMGKGTLQFFQHALFVAGVVLLATSVWALIDRSVSSRHALRAFDQAQTARPALDDVRARWSKADDSVNFALWSDKRIREYKESLAIEKGLPLAVLSIRKLRVRVPVFDGTDDVVLNRGIGWIDGTARPGERGNIGLAGHRDGFFRGLNDIVLGDALLLTTPKEQATYLVDQIEIVSPERVDVLRPRDSPSITLVTCYPFYFVGDAPQRFIVHATLDPATASNPQEGHRR